MPIHTYRCPACGHGFDELIPPGELPETMPCPRCGQSAARQFPGGQHYRFVGAGFYENDYKRKAKDGDKEAR